MATTPNDNVKITVDDRRVREMLAKAPEETALTVHQLLERNGIQVMAEMRRQVSVGVTGDLRRTIHYVFRGTGEVAIEPQAKYAEPVEKGTRPHWVSVKPGTPLYRWATQKAINPYAVQKSIAKKGTMPHPFIQPTYDIMEPRVRRDFNEGIDALIARLA